MKNIIKKITFAALALGAVFMAFPATTFAAGVFNNHAQDLATVRVSNYSTEPASSASWSSSVNSAAGQVVSVGIYYHNNGNATANNTRIRLSPQNSGSSNSHSFTASVWADGVNSASGSATINIIDGPESVSYIPTGVYWYPNQCNSNSCRQDLLSGQNGSEIFTSNGLNIGNIASGWGSQGGVTVQFRVSDNGGNNDTDHPSATTQSAMNIDEDSATLRGAYAMNGVAGETWFEWGTSSGNLDNETPMQSHSSGSSGSISYGISGLEAGETYYFRACVQHTSGTYNGQDFCGSVLHFTTQGDNGPSCEDDDSCGGDDDISVDTNAAENIDEDSATLVGDINDIGSGNVERWFEWDTNESDVEDGDGNTLSLSGDTDSTGEFSRSLTGLNDDTTYYFRACGEDDDGNEDCGNVRHFSTDEDRSGGGCSDMCENDRPDVTTLSAFGIGQSFATLNGYYDANGSSTDVWFEWGRTSSLGNTTPRQGKGNNEGGMTYLFTGLAANTTYYYRAVAENNDGIARGAILSFRTTSGGVIVPPTIISGGAGTFLRLQIENGEEFVSRGDRLDYEVEWENISGRDLENLVIEIDMPEQLVIEDVTEGKISKKDNTVVLNIGDLERGEDGDMIITARVKSGQDGDPIVAQATAAFDHPTIEEKTQINAIAYDSDEYDASRSGLGASLFGLFDGNIVGLLLILLLVVLVILIARKQFMDSKDKKARATVAPATNGADMNGGYRPYRPTPIQQ